MAASKNIRLKISVHNKINLGSLTAKMNANEKRKFRQEIEKRMINAKNKITSVAVKNMVQSTVLNLRKVKKEEAHITTSENIMERYFTVVSIFMRLYMSTPIDEAYSYEEEKKVHRARKYKDEVKDGKKTGRRVAVKQDVTYKILRVHTPDEIRTRDFWRLKINGLVYTPKELGMQLLDEVTGSAPPLKLVIAAVYTITAHTGMHRINSVHIWNENPIENQYSRLEYGLYQYADTNPIHYGSAVTVKSDRRNTYTRTKGKPHGVKKGYSVQAPKGIARLVLAQSESLSEVTTVQGFAHLTSKVLMSFQSRKFKKGYGQEVTDKIEKKLMAGNTNIYETLNFNDSNTELDIDGTNKIKGKLTRYERQRIVNTKYKNYKAHTFFSRSLDEEDNKRLEALIRAAISFSEFHSDVIKEANKIKNEQEEKDLEIKIEKESKVIKAKKKVVIKKKVQPKKKAGLVGKFGEKIIKSYDWTESIAGVLAPSEWDESSMQDDLSTRVIAIDEMGEEWVAFTDATYEQHFGVGWHHLKEIEAEINKLDLDDPSLRQVKSTGIKFI